MYNSDATGPGFHFSNPAIINNDEEEAEFLSLLGGAGAGQGSKTPTYGYQFSSDYILQNLANNTLNPTTSIHNNPPSPPEPSSSSSESPPSASITTTTSALVPSSSTANDSAFADYRDSQSTSYYRDDVPMASRATRSTHHRDSQTGEPGQKRKVIDDLDDESSDEDAPLRKVQHTDPSGKKSATKRKSISGGAPDESRLQKRKEQNRAAQRAFRERKERHVKDLEDKVSMLEEKTDSQAAENENLRELLTRLQQENLTLRQSQFNFTFQQPLASTSAAGSGTSQQQPQQQGYSASSSRQQNAGDSNNISASSKSNVSSSQSPIHDGMSGLSRMISPGSTSSTSSTSLNGNSIPGGAGGANNSRPQLTTPQLVNNTSPPGEFTLLDTIGVPVTTPELSFSATSAPLAGLTPPSNSSFTLMDTSFFDNASGFGGSSSSAAAGGANGGSTMNASGDFTMFGDFPSSFAPMPYQTIAANPMYTSYRDPSANPNAWASFGPNQSQGLALSMYDELFGGGAGFSSTATPTTAVGTTSYPAPGSIPLDDPSSNSGSVSGLTPQQQAAMNAASALIGFDDLIPFSLMPDLSGGTGGSQFAGLSPISHMPTPPSATATTATSVKTGTSTPSGALPAGLGMGASPSSPDQLMASPSKHMEVAEDWHGAGTGQSCPKTKEEVSHALKAAGMSVFGPSEPTTNNNNNTGDQSNSNTSSNSNAMMEDMLSGGADVCSSTSGPKKPMPMADATKLNLDIGTAWRAVRQHPQFEECDIDELCAELAKKATCDGTSKVIEAQQIMDLVHSIPERAKQRKLNLISRPVA